ncbi:hypothetical protein AAX26_01961 [Aliarcobacter thereius]|uniref:AAA family ATPase n=1 Tax=Aliarcobacter thereius TaxID=544718 RepID=UPI0008287607|nr:AAA family ATPase [Aliarcobacter thereius]OCL85533.1 hypothetical protein AAX26_01961 [Aliarcobacter thereius]
MYLKKIKIINFRKFRNKKNIVEFVDSKDSLKTVDDINVAKATSLIVGKNNSGKTTIVNALDYIVNKQNFKPNDFNFIYLNDLLTRYKKEQFKFKPILSFQLTIGIDERNHDDLFTNFDEFINLRNAETSTEEKEFTIIIKYEISNDKIFIEKIKQLIKDNTDDNVLFDKFLLLLNEDDMFSYNYYNLNNKLIEKYNIKNLIKIETIRPNENQDEKSLSNLFSKIIEAQYNKGIFETNDFNILIDGFNIEATNEVEKKFTGNVNKAVNKIHDQNTINVHLSSDISLEKLLRNKLIKYQYAENGIKIPEDQFGLGYRNLMRIVAELIDYIEKYPEDDKHSKLNLICIEEPEVFMHPQMQELFIKNINDAINTLLGSSEKKLNSQLIISTHSAHILNSKIHTSDTFDNINYVYEDNKMSNVVNLKDSLMISDKKINSSETEIQRKKRRTEELKFIKNHIKFKASELFFSDAIIFVEGITEEVLLSYFLNSESKLNKKYITIFNINGAHGLKYHHLIKLLGVPTVVITDLDIKRSESEKEYYLQINSLFGRNTTNNTIKKYNTLKLKLKSLKIIWKPIHQTFSLLDFPMYSFIKNNSISLLNVNHFIDNNLYITFQGDKIEDVFATSLEESFILTNYDNKILNNTLYGTIRNKYLKIIGKEKDKLQLVHNSYRLQRELSDSKSDFANELLYQLSINENEMDIPILPSYIKNAFEWLEDSLNLNNDEEE